MVVERGSRFFRVLTLRISRLWTLALALSVAHMLLRSGEQEIVLLVSAESREWLPEAVLRFLVHRRKARRKVFLAGRRINTEQALGGSLVRHLRFERPGKEEAWSYYVLQRLTYLLVIFVLFPLMIWTGLAMSFGFTSEFPLAVRLLGGQQTARSLHFLVTIVLMLFLLIHVLMVFVAQHSPLVRTVRKRSDGRTDSGQNRCIEEERNVDGWASSAGIRSRSP